MTHDTLRSPRAPRPLTAAPIDVFRGSYRFLSNFWGCSIRFDGATYPTVENAYQAAKTLDLRQRRPLENCSPGDAKRFGRRLLLRPDWEAAKLSVMRDLLAAKFRCGSDLATLLDRTGHHLLVEGNAWGDTFWGVCRGRGENHLGRLLMERRALNRRAAYPAPYPLAH